uniref:Uncharacterized protein n=1 Tax=Melanothamnus harveyi TaxID=397005 RepID=A0A1Z1MIB7_MELHR|nr:hypothetical protein [Melanothamnus harveyi]ARW65484.1 hypothetical protein [Melanothamnus harveyi]
MLLLFSPDKIHILFIIYNFGLKGIITQNCEIIQ